MKDEQRHSDDLALLTLVEPEAPEAGASVTVTVTCGIAALVEGAATDAVLLDPEGRALAIARMEPDPGSGEARAVLTVNAPPTAGTHRWLAVLRESEAPADGVSPIAQQEVAIEVCTHTVRPVVWNLPTAIETSARATFRVGLRCTGGCDTSGWSFRVLDESRREVHVGTFGDSASPGTDELRFADVDCPAPDQAGRHRWQIEAFAPHDAPLPHNSVPVDLHLVIVRPPDHVIRVRAIDAATREPVARVKVVAHPFRTLTNADGTAELAVPAGRYTVFVSGQQYFATHTEVEVDGDLDLDAEMYLDRDYSEVDEWA